MRARWHFLIGLTVTCAIGYGLYALEWYFICGLALGMPIGFGTAFGLIAVEMNRDPKLARKMGIVEEPL